MFIVATLHTQLNASADSKILEKPFEDYLRFSNKLTHSTCGASELLYYRTKGIELMFKLKL